MTYLLGFLEIDIRKSRGKTFIIIHPMISKIFVNKLRLDFIRDTTGSNNNWRLDVKNNATSKRKSFVFIFQG